LAAADQPPSMYICRVSLMLSPRRKICVMALMLAAHDCRTAEHPLGRALVTRHYTRPPLRRLVPRPQLAGFRGSADSGPERVGAVVGGIEKAG
jgi:hypothetical protein